MLPRVASASQLITTLNGNALGAGAMGLFFYDGPEKPAIFDLFDGLATILDNTGQKSFPDLVASFPSYLVANVRGTFATFSTSGVAARFLDAVRAEAEAIGQVSALHNGTTVSYDIEPFTQYGQHATDSAYPHGDSLLPQSLATLKQVAKDEGIYQDSFVAYPNYATADTTAEALYGAANVRRLRAIRDRIDPDRVMDLAGGFSL
ncbi:7c09011b-95e8-4631-80b9-58097e272ecf [Thermothielavioides terrestris]|uniref:7c09011b-95e8-4631-80b9-58097e272ecf n=1 Tax=Thermothielavioides terrestris TaxID=2587410 RepID=A0A3S4F3K5_9PEZI|nr:7c09011b-95e8-4631-80b9-58097e272ecf [Thermothielavioides terrestris]